jgi:hypothetical protein
MRDIERGLSLRGRLYARQKVFGREIKEIGEMKEMGETV